MKAEELRQKFLKFFESKGHKIIPSASLIPENDPSVLFTTAGMHPLVPYLLGEKHPAGNRLTNVQKCIRTGDIDEVGDVTHHTFFEMLGNWSLGDYFKKEAVEWSFEFLTSPEYLNLDKNRIAVSVFQGDQDSPFDEEAYNLWKNLGIPEKRIAKLPKKNNWWGMDKGPCGPDTEMFYWVGDANKVPESFNDDDNQWVEIWNDVFMQFNKMENGKLELATQKNVDTGMGMERTLAAINGLDDNYQTELFWPIIEKIQEISGKKYEDNKKSFRIIADHVKASVFIISDGIKPAREKQGYVVRKLIRRAIEQGSILGINENFIKHVAEPVIEIYKTIYNNVEKNKQFIFSELEKEENKYRSGLAKLSDFIDNKEDNFWYKQENGETFKKDLFSYTDAGNLMFDLYQTNGLPFDAVFEELNKRGQLKGVVFDKNKLKEIFDKNFKEHQEKSRTASAGMFKGGLADSSEETRKLHTAAHLMLAALRIVLGEHVIQKGSNITAERLRFDFSHPEKMTPEQIKQVEDLVNEQIQKNIPVVCEEMTLDEAKKQSAMGIFDSKYGEKVKVYTIGDFSKEICGGPHVDNTYQLGKFKIKKEESSSAGIRRIKAVLG